MFLPVLAYYVLFCYKPMYGVIIAFKDFTPRRGIFGSPWVGMKHFINFVQGAYFLRTFRNTILINLYQLLFGFPAPILLAVLLNELRDGAFKRVVQTISYMPHFISTVVIVGIVKTLFSYNGVFTTLMVMMGMQRMSVIAMPQFFRSLYVGSGIWQTIG